MAIITLRLVKGSPLTNQEVDSNFSNINTEVGIVNANVGILSSLSTVLKSNLVAALNEVNSKVSNGGNVSGITINNSTWNGNVIPFAKLGGVQAQDQQLDDIAALTPSADTFIMGNSTHFVSVNASQARTGLGLGTLATQDASSVSVVEFDVSGNVEILQDLIVTGIANITGGIETSGDITANTFIGDGSQLTGVAGGGSGLFNTSLSDTAGLEMTTLMGNIFAADATYIIHSIHVTNIDGINDASASGQIVGALYDDISFSNLVPVPAGSSVELLKKPKVLSDGDYVQLQASANSDLHATITLEMSDSNEYFGSGVDITNAATFYDLYLSNTNSVIESVLLSNDSPDSSVKTRVVWTDISNTIQGYYVYDMVIPFNSTVEVLEQPKYLSANSKVRVYCNVGGRLEAIIAGKIIV